MNPKTTPPLISGGYRQYGAGMSQKDIDEYISGQQIMYGAGLKHYKSGGAKIKHRTRKNKPHKWSAKYKRSIDCKNPKGFSQKQYCKYGRNKTKRSRRKH